VDSNECRDHGGPCVKQHNRAWSAALLNTIPQVLETQRSHPAGKDAKSMTLHRRSKHKSYRAHLAQRGRL